MLQVLRPPESSVHNVTGWYGCHQRRDSTLQSHPQDSEKALPGKSYYVDFVDLFNEVICFGRSTTLFWQLWSIQNILLLIWMYYCIIYWCFIMQIGTNIQDFKCSWLRYFYQKVCILFGTWNRFGSDFLGELWKIYCMGLGQVIKNLLIHSQTFIN